MPRPVSPPPGKPVTELRTPNVKDGFFSVLIERDSAEYQAQYPMKRGTPYAAIIGADQRVIDEFSSNPLYLLKETRPGASSSADFGSSDKWILWIFATQELAQNTYDFSRDYPGEDVTVSRYIHQSQVRRNTDEATPSIAYGSTLTGLMSVNITAPGINYTQATGTIATGATVTFVCFNGQLILGIVTNQGTGVTSGGAITITGDGTGATATARIQPATAILTHQEMKQLPDDDPRSHDYVQLVRVYEILPGPLLPFTRWDERLGPIQGTRQAVVNTGQAPTLTQTVKTTYDARDGSSYVSWEIVETYSNGTGGAGNPAFPVIYSSFYDPDWKAVVTRTEQLTASIPNSASISEAAGVVTKITYQKYDQFHEIIVTDTWTIPDQDVEYWDFVSLPTLVFDIDPTVTCNDSPFFTVITQVDKALGMTCMRKHRRTVTYSFTTTPDPDLSSSSFEPANIEYKGKSIQFQFANALNDLLDFDGTLCISSEMDACCWDETWNFPASTPNATDFAAGDWFVRDHDVQLIDNSVPVWRTTKIEYFSAAGEPP